MKNLELPFHDPLQSDDEKRIRTLTREISQTEIRPYVIDDDRTCFFRRKMFTELARHGLTSILVPKEWGGLGLSHHCYFAFLEEVARSSGAMTVTVSVTNLTQGAITQFGSKEQKQKYLPVLASGEWLGAFSLSESCAGSDAASLRLSAKKVARGYELTGTKLWCSSGGEADLYLVMGRTSDHKSKGVSSFLVPNKAPGFRVGKYEKKLGLRSSPLTELVFEKCFVPEEDRLGEEGSGLPIAFTQLDFGRIGIAAAGAGVCREAIEQVLLFLRKHNKDEVRVQSVLFGLSTYFARLQALKCILSLASELKDHKQPVMAVAAQAKLLGSDLAMETASFAVECLGDYGYLPENHVERLLRDAKALQIVEGTNQIQKLVLCREMRKLL